MEKFLKILENINLIGIIVLIAAFAIGIKFPDWDFKLKLKHRNILTHSPFVTIILLYYYFKMPNEVSRYFIIGFSMAMGIHFIFDIFPKGWGGGSLLQIPFICYSCKPKITKMLLNIFILTSFFITIILTKNEIEFLLLFLLGLISLIKNIKKEKKIMRPLLAYSLFFVGFGLTKYQKLYQFIFENIRIK